MRMLFCVQAYRRTDSGLQRGEAHRYTSATEAEEVGEVLSSRYAGVIVYGVEAKPEWEIWGEPWLLAEFGDVPTLRI